MNRTVDAYRRTRTEGSRPLLRWAAVTIAAAVAVLLLLPAPIFAQAIFRIHYNEPLQDLFPFPTLEEA